MQTTLPRLRTMVRDVLQLPESEDIDMRTLRELGAGSLQTVALQFRILQETSVNVEMEELVGGSHIADIATLIDVRRPPAQ
ncbi:MAG TPA: acyl carrier protein [Actinocrinis sp.]|uniref:acyl carrier protein n=1 Tax=Actinocrinis sp. TaxID=1920516 RepID=UPI002DDD1814|nr:acyl carrier protein [Actinocrinis sp.]HEV2343202.1 acyl carrier protein [Actinocrinis sp.]